MWDGKKKAITFSFDDGVSQDMRVIEIMNKYGLKGTFNINSGKLGLHNEYMAGDRLVYRDILGADAFPKVYEGHELAVHTLKHLNLTTLSDEEVIFQVEEDRKNLEKLGGYPIVGMAYPCGGVNNNEHVAELIRTHTPIRYARTITSTYSFELQKEHLLQFHATLHFLDAKTEETVEKFLALETDKPQLLYIWGHSYELDSADGLWERFEALCRMLSGKEDVFYGTNREVLL